jgi:hypothetical protein
VEYDVTGAPDNYGGLWDGGQLWQGEYSGEVSSSQYMWHGFKTLSDPPGETSYSPEKFDIEKGRVLERTIAESNENADPTIMATTASISGDGTSTQAVAAVISTGWRCETEYDAANTNYPGGATVTVVGTRDGDAVNTTLWTGTDKYEATAAEIKGALEVLKDGEPFPVVNLNPHTDIPNGTYTLVIKGWECGSNIPAILGTKEEHDDFIQAEWDAFDAAVEDAAQIQLDTVTYKEYTFPLCTDENVQASLLMLGRVAPLPIEQWLHYYWDAMPVVSPSTLSLNMDVLENWVWVDPPED